MTGDRTNARVRGRWATALVVTLALPAGFAGEAVRLDSPREAPQTASLVPGLLPVYYYGDAHYHVDEVASKDPASGQLGPPLLTVDYHTGSDLVLTSTGYDAVGAHISGFIHLDKTGTYQFGFQSNDGVRLHLNGQFIVEDPDVHADQYSRVVDVAVEKAGWYPITIWYFEKQNTSTLRLYWRTPGTSPDDDMEIVPAGALRHLKP